MEQPHKELAAAASASSPASASAGSSPSSTPAVRGSMASAFLGVSSSSTTHSSQSQQPRSSPSLYPPPRPPLPGAGHLSSGSPAATSVGVGSSAARSSPSSSQSRLLHRISPSPWAAAKRRSRPHARVTHSLPTPFLSELSSIRRTRASSVFGDLNHAQEMSMTQRPFLLPGQQQQSSSTMLPHHPTPIPSGGELSGVPAGLAPPPLQAQPSSSFTTLQPLPGSGGNFSGLAPLPQLPLPASQAQPEQMQMQMQLPTSSIFSGLALLPLPLAASQHFSTTTYVGPVPSSTSTIFQQPSSSSSADHVHVQPSSSDSVLPPLPPSLEIHHQQLSPNNNGSSIIDQSTSGFMQPPSSDSETYELPPLPESLQMPVAVAPEPDSTISLDHGDADELTAFVNSFFASSSPGHGLESASPLPNHMHDEQPANLDLEGMQGLPQMGSSSSEVNMGSAAANGVGVGQTMEEAVPTPPANVHDKVNTGGATSRSRIPWNMPLYSVSLSEEEALRQLSKLLAKWSSTASSSSSQSTGSSVSGGSSQDWAAMPELANKFGMMSIGDSSSSAGTKMPGNSTPVPVPAVPKLLLGGMVALPPRPPALGSGASSSKSRRGGTAKEHNFSEADMETINKDSRLKELLKTDAKRLKRVLRNRDHAARLKEQKENRLQDLEDRVDALKTECDALSAQVESQQETMANLKAKSREMEIKLEGLKEQDRLSQGLNNQLQSEIERLKKP